MRRTLAGWILLLAGCTSGGTGSRDLGAVLDGATSPDLSLRVAKTLGFSANAYPAGPAPQGLALTDLDHDGRMDLLVADNNNYQAGSVGVLLAQSDGSLGSVQKFAAGNGPYSVAAGDWNGDGKSDVAVAEFGGAVGILLGNGDGTLGAQATIAIGPSTYSVQAIDLTGDQKLDLIATNSTSTAGRVTVLRGKGDGTFAVGNFYPADTAPLASVFGDFNSDGKSDLALASGGKVSDNVGKLDVLLGNGDGTFRPSMSFATGSITSAVAAGDFNRDGKPDLAACDFGDPMGIGGDLAVLLGNGDGTFAPAVIYSAGVAPNGVVAADFDDDGLLDLAVTAQGDNVVYLLTGRDDGTFKDAVPFPTGASPTAIVAPDWNGDGLPDLVVANSSDDSVTILLNTSH